MYCAGCGNQIADEADACEKCGHPLANLSGTTIPQPLAESGQHGIPVWVLILILGALFVGIGQFLVNFMGQKSISSVLPEDTMNVPNPSPPSLYEGMVKQLHAGMTFDSVVAQLGTPYLSEYNIGNHMSAIYRVNGTIFPLVVRFQKVESLVIKDPSAKVDSWCAYVQAKESGDYSVLLFAPTNMSASEQARWISGHGFSFPAQARISDADPDRPQGGGRATKLVEAQSVHNSPDAPVAGSPGVVLVDKLNLRLTCHPVI